MSCGLFAAAFAYAILSSTPTTAAYHAGTAGVSRALDEALSLLPSELADDAVLERLHRTAMAGDAVAQRHLGAMYYMGERVNQNTTEAMLWLRQAASTGDVSSQRSVGLMYREGAGVSQNKHEAVQWFLRAAESTGEDVLVERREAQAALCYAFLLGDGVEQNDAIGAAWCQKAAENGDVASFAWMGRLHLEGRGVPQDIEESIRWYQKAAGYGDRKAEVQVQDLQEPERRSKHTKRAARSSPLPEDPPQVEPTESNSPWLHLLLSAMLWGTVILIVCLGKSGQMQVLVGRLCKMEPKRVDCNKRAADESRSKHDDTCKHQSCPAVLQQMAQSPPDAICCPITQEVVHEPVLLVGDGHTYERAAITEWLRDHNTSPLTNQILDDLTLVPNHAVKKMVAEWIHALTCETLQPR